MDGLSKIPHSEPWQGPKAVVPCMHLHFLPIRPSSNENGLSHASHLQHRADKGTLAHIGRADHIHVAALALTTNLGGSRCNTYSTEHSIAQHDLNQTTQLPCNWCL